ncbi:MAG: UDP-3-O-(3-hydroxymyristoyl)glucosamine N-acyltransferase [Phycisphaerae bacterium]|jgi:UDP-3-O-[3-hydroxymyristoyl] glucosamine N-acyltransferase
MMFTTAQLAEKIGARLDGDGSVEIKAVSPVASASATGITFVTDDKHLADLSKCEAAAVIIDKPAEDFGGVQLIVSDVNAALIKTLKLFAPKLSVPAAGIHPSAVIGRDVQIAKSASIGANVTIADNVRVGENSVLAAGVQVGQNSTIGNDTRIDSNVVIYHNCSIGSGVIIQANTTIGSTGFGYAQVDGRPVLIPHIGGVIIEDYVEIGANCCVDRAKFANTIIGAGTKIDNLVQIAHNVIIGRCCLIVSQVGISGSSRLGDGVIIAGQVGIVDNVNIGDGVVVGAQAGVTKDIPAGTKALGSPAIDYAEKVRQFALMNRLPETARQIKELIKKVKALEAAADDKK